MLVELLLLLLLQPRRRLNPMEPDLGKGGRKWGKEEEGSATALRLQAAEGPLLGLEWLVDVVDSSSEVPSRLT